MVDTPHPRVAADPSAALADGVAAADLSHLRTVAVGGADASGWLDALLTTDVESMIPGQAQRSLFLSPTGHIRADVTVARTGDGFVLLQEPDQPEPIAGALSIYVLSSAVTLEDVDLALFSVPRDPRIPGTLWTARPSPLGGIIIAFPHGARDEVAGALAATFPLAGVAAVEEHRIRSGVARFPVDLLPTSIPAEAGLDSLLVDTGKGCFPGQESVAKVRNLGHPAFVVKAFRTEAALAPGAELLDDGEIVGEVTSAATGADGTKLIARIRWSEHPRDGLTASDGNRLEPSD